MRLTRYIWMSTVLLPMSASAQTPSKKFEDSLPAIATAINGNKWDELKSTTVGNPHTVFSWNDRPGANFGGIVKRNWRVQVVNPPSSNEWLAVIWANQPAESMGDHVHKLVKIGSEWKIGPEIPETETNGFRLRDHVIDVKFDLTKNFGTFTDDLSVERTTPSSTHLQFRISADFKVTSIKSATGPVTFKQIGGVVFTTAPAGNKFKLNLAYSGSAVHPDMFVGNFITNKEVVLTAYWYPTIGRLPTTHSVSVTVPQGWTAIGQGNELGKTVNGANQTFKFKMTVPTVYFTLDAAPYSIYQRTVGGRTYRVYLPKPDPIRGNKQTELMDASFRLFEKLWGPYLWDKFTIVETHQPGWPGALEAYSFTTYGGGIIPGDNPHEWGHTWWGGFVPNTYLNDISNESLATYSESVFYRRGKGSATSFPARDKVYWQRSVPGLDTLVSSISMSESFDALNASVNMVGYQKGGLVMQALEEELGFDMLQKCLRQVREEFLFSGNAASWPDFERIISKTSGRDLKWFFDQWVRQAGLPKLSWENVTTNSVDGKYEVEGDIVQTGKKYQLKVPVWLTTSGGETVKTVVTIREGRTRIKLSSPNPPDRLYIDPEIRIPRVMTNAENPKTVIPGRDALIVVGAANRAEVEFLKTGERTIKLDTDVTDKDLEDTHVILYGNMSNNKVWAKYARLAPFDATSSGIRFHGMNYSGMVGKGISTHPLDPRHKFFWYTGKTADTSKTGFGGNANPVTSGVYSTNGDIVAAYLVLPEVGAGTYSFNNK